MISFEVVPVVVVSSAIIVSNKVKLQICIYSRSKRHSRVPYKNESGFSNKQLSIEFFSRVNIQNAQ